MLTGCAYAAYFDTPRVKLLATQYVSTKIGYTYAVVHPSNADIRFVGFDN